MADVLESYISEAELAKQLSKSQRTLQRWRRLRIGPAWTTIGNSTLYTREGVAQWLRSLEHRPQRKRSAAA